MSRDDRRSIGSVAGDPPDPGAGVLGRLALGRSLADVEPRGVLAAGVASPRRLIDWMRRDGRDVRCWTRPDGGIDVTLAGPAAAPGIARDDVARWVGEAIAGPRPRLERLRSLANHWLVVVEDRDRGAVHFATDPLGVYPLFLATPTEAGESPAELAFGCDVWELREAGLLADAAINYRAIAAWLLFSYDYSGGSLFEGTGRAPPGCVVTVDREGRRQIDYCGFEAEARPVGLEEATTRLHRLVSENLETSITAAEGGIALALSGGFDSRYLLGLTSRVADVDLVAYTVEWDEAERRAAGLAAEAVGVRRVKISVQKSLYDFFASWNRFSPEGFPARPDVVAEIARRYASGRTIMHGYLGGPMVGGRSDRLNGWEGEGGRDAFVEALLEHHAFSGLYMFRSHLQPAIHDVAAGLIEQMLAQGGPPWRRLDVLRTNLCLRQRFYIAHNFVSHLDVASAVVPFYSHALLDFKFRHAIAAPQERLYPETFRRFLPELADLPIDRTLRQERLTRIWARSWFLRRQSVRQLSRMLAADAGPVSRHESVPRLLARVLGYTGTNGWVFLLQRIERLERRLAQAGLEIEWERLAEPGVTADPGVPMSA